MDLKYPQEELESERLILKRLEVTYVDKMFKAVDFDRERLTKFLPWVPWLKVEADELRYIETAKKSWMAGELFDYAIFRKSDMKYLGNCGGHNISWDDQKIEFGYWIVAEGEGQGLMSEAVLALEKEFFAIGFHRIEIRCDPNNLRSAAIPKRLGYELEGRLRDNLFAEGAFRDTFVFAKLGQISNKSLPFKKTYI